MVQFGVHQNLMAELEERIRDLFEGLIEAVVDGEDWAEATLEQAFECTWCNMRDDKPIEYFNGHPLEELTIAEVTVMMEELAKRLKVDWPNDNEAGT